MGEIAIKGIQTKDPVICKCSPYPRRKAILRQVTRPVPKSSLRINSDLGIDFIDFEVPALREIYNLQSSFISRLVAAHFPASCIPYQIGIARLAMLRGFRSNQSWASRCIRSLNLDIGDAPAANPKVSKTPSSIQITLAKASHFACVDGQ